MSSIAENNSALLDPGPTGAPTPPTLPQSPTRPGAVSGGKLWTGRILSGLTVLFMLVDAIGKLIKPVPTPIADAFARLGFPLSLAVAVAILLLISTIVYAIPRTAVLGAVLLTGYLGGAVAIHLRAGSPTFEAVFPVIFGVIAWAGILLREPRLLQLFPLRSTGR
jgi:hypothetical protein